MLSSMKVFASFRPFSSRATMVTRAPRRANRAARASPSPREPPVINTCLAIREQCIAAHKHGDTSIRCCSKQYQVECKHYLLRVVKVACRHRRIKNQAVCHIAIDKKKRTMMDRTMRSSTKSRNMMQPAAPRNRVELGTALREHSNR